MKDITDDRKKPLHKTNFKKYKIKKIVTKLNILSDYNFSIS
jgi:hypothetical protein